MPLLYLDADLQKHFYPVMAHLRVITSNDTAPLIFSREGETRIGEKLTYLSSQNWEQELKDSKAGFVLLGIPEDIGVRANYGIGGTQSLWEPTLKALLNVQATAQLNGDDLLVLGWFDFQAWISESYTYDVAALRELVARMDAVIFPVVESIIRTGKIPLVVGGGHNNAYPLLKGAASAIRKPINCINLDAHSDYRSMEGRHSGNGFRYAKSAGYLDRYAVIGLHRNYNSQAVLDDLDADDTLLCSFYEDIFLYGEKDFQQAIGEAISFTAAAPTGIELDMDAIENALSSAATPAGIPVVAARQYLTMCADAATVAYLHLAEGACRLSDGREQPLLPKLATYLLTDFIRTKNRHRL